MITVDKASVEFLLACRADGLKPVSIQWYRHMLKSLNTWFFGKALQDVTTHQLRGYIAALRERPTRYQKAKQRPEMAGGLSHESLRDHLRAMRRFFNWSWTEYEYPPTTNPMLKIRMPSRERQEPKAIDLDDLSALFKACDESDLGKRNCAILAFLADTGCRAGALLTLTIKNLHLEEHYAIVRTKGDRDLAAPFTELTAVILRDWMMVRPWEAGEFVFCGLRRGGYGQPLKLSGLHRAIKELAKRAGVSGRVNPHSFRHGFAREYIKNGGDLATLSQLMGHYDVSVTVANYAIFKDRDLAAFHQKFTPMRKVKTR